LTHLSCGRQILKIDLAAYWFLIPGALVWTIAHRKVLLTAIGKSVRVAS
jgi:hypothetical protein